MASMSYCRFENTSIDMSNCVNDLEDAYSFDELDHNEYEAGSRKRLYELSKEYISQYERLLEVESFEK
jgi:hypothetical protein